MDALVRDRMLRMAGVEVRAFKPNQLRDPRSGQWIDEGALRHLQDAIKDGIKGSRTSVSWRGLHITAPVRDRDVTITISPLDVASVALMFVPGAQGVGAAATAGRTALLVSRVRRALTVAGGAASVAGAVSSARRDLDDEDDEERSELQDDDLDDEDVEEDLEELEDAADEEFEDEDPAAAARHRSLQLLGIELRRKLPDRIQAGFEGGGQFRGPATRIVALLKDWNGHGDPLAGFTQPQLKSAATTFGLNPPKGMRLVPLKALILDAHREGRVRAPEVTVKAPAPRKAIPAADAQAKFRIEMKKLTPPFGADAKTQWDDARLYALGYKDRTPEDAVRQLEADIAANMERLRKHEALDIEPHLQSRTMRALPDDIDRQRDLVRLIRKTFGLPGPGKKAAPRKATPADTVPTAATPTISSLRQLGDKVAPAESASSVRPELMKARSLAKLRDAAEAEAERVTGRSWIGAFKYRDDWDIQTAREHTEGILRALQRYPQAEFGGLKPQGRGFSPGGDSQFFLRAHRLMGGIEVGDEFATKAGRERYLTRITNNNRRQFWAAGVTDPVGIAVHEFGHVLDDATLAEAAHPRVEALVGQMAERAGVSPRRFVGTEISHYAADGGTGELIGEALADVMLRGDRASDLAHQVVAILDDEYAKSGLRLGSLHVPTVIAEATKGSPATPDISSLRQLGDKEAIRDQLDLLTLDKIKPLLRDEKLPVSGKKRDLVDRLTEHLSGGRGTGPSASIQREPARAVAAASDRPSSMSDIAYELDQLPTIRAKRAQLRKWGFSPEQIDQLVPLASRRSEDHEELEARAMGPEQRDRLLALLGVTRAAGQDITPGRDQLHHYWTRGEGLAKWRGSPHPWTTLRRHLMKYMNPAMATRAASKWFEEVFGYSAGSDLHRVDSGKPPRGKRIGPG